MDLAADTSCMRFLLHGVIHPDAAKALAKHEHAVHTALELSGDTDAPAEMLSDPELLLALLEKKQWNLVTTDTGFVQQMYEQKVNFPGVIVLLLDTETTPESPTPQAGQDEGIDRLFERYPRLTPRRLYTVTPSRVKIRQLPGAAQA
jgi:hypothetical protein